MARLVLLVLAVGAPFWLGPATRPALGRQDAASPPIVVGAGPVRERAFALTGRTVYDGESARAYGYLTEVIGLDPALLFVDAPPSVRTARFTYAGDIALAARDIRGDTTSFAGEGTVTVYYDETAGAAWDDPASFAAGEPVAELSLVWRDTLQRQAPTVGVVVGDARYRQETAGEFVADVASGETYRFGQSGIDGRLRTVGALIGSEGEPGLAVGLTGAGSVAARETIPVIPGESGA